MVKVYLKARYGGEVIAGNSSHILKVMTEPTADGTLLNFVVCSRAERVILQKMGLTLESEELAQATAPEPEDEEVRKTPPPIDEDSETDDPDEYYCQDHDEVHQKGTALYYACLSNYVNGEAKTGDKPEPKPSKGLNDLPHANTKNITQLKKAGYETVESIALANIDDLIKVPHVGKITAKWLVSEAKDALG